jgi:MbtH protein
MKVADWQDGAVKVVVNDEDQYSLWPADRANPAGWRDAGMAGTQGECLEYVKQVWADMVPRSLRRPREDN